MNAEWTPSPDDVEAAAKEIAPEARFDYGATWINLTNADDLVRTTIGVLHARGWRDPAEVGAMVDSNARYCIHCGWPEARPIVPPAFACCPDHEFLSERELIAQRDTWKNRACFEQAFTEEMRKERDAAIARAEAAEAKLAEAEKKFTAANQRAIQLERNAVLTTNGLAFAAAAVERDAARAEVEAMAARFDEAARLAESIAAQRDAATSREHALIYDLEEVIDEWERMGDEPIAACTAAEVIVNTIDKSNDANRLAADDSITALRKEVEQANARTVYAEERWREYKREWESAVERADSSEALRKEASADRDALAERVKRAEGKLHAECRRVGSLASDFSECSRKAKALADECAAYAQHALRDDDAALAADTAEKGKQP